MSIRLAYELFRITNKKFKKNEVKKGVLAVEARLGLYQVFSTT